MKTITVPRSQDAAERLDTNSCINDDLIEIEINLQEYTDLWETGALQKINAELGLLIDDYEDESILGTHNLTAAKKIIDSATTPKNSHILLKITKQIEHALAFDTGVYFFF